MKLLMIPAHLQTEISKRISNLLEKLKICDSCILRFVGVRSIAEHKNVITNSLPIKFQQHSGHIFRPHGNAPVTDSHPEEMAKELSVCTACLGILQLDFNAIARNGIDRYTAEKFELDDNSFNLGIKLPAQLIIRQSSIVHYISTNIKYRTK
jgi:tRNA U54 and U55 pseudouridine synthase Pus10